MKSHPHLLVRDALAEVFVEAAEGNADADRRLDALVGWARREPEPGALADIRAADGTPLFLTDGRLDPGLAHLEGYVRDRAMRYAAARDWIRRDRTGSNVFERARAAWDAGLFFEVHEILEPEWMNERGPDRGPLQGLIMAAAGLHHLCDGNRAGAVGLFREGARRIREAGPGFPVAVEPLAEALDELAARIDAGEVRDARDVRDVPPFRPAGARSPGSAPGVA